MNLQNYQDLWNTMVITKPNSVEDSARLILKGKQQYESVVKDTKVPWYLVGVLHYRESTCNFKTHLHNGDPLTQRTTHVPSGRPIKGNPPFTWIESAKDALFTLSKLDTVAYWDLPTILYQAEKYNGMGYNKRGVPSPYVWNGTNHYTGGKYSSDGKYDPKLIDKQMGAAPLIRYLTDKTLGLV